MLYYLMSFTVRIQKVGRGSQFSAYVLCSMTVTFDMLAVPGLEVTGYPVSGTASL